MDEFRQMRTCQDRSPMLRALETIFAIGELGVSENWCIKYARRVLMEREQRSGYQTCQKASRAEAEARAKEMSFGWVTDVAECVCRI